MKSDSEWEMGDLCTQVKSLLKYLFSSLCLTIEKRSE